MAWPTAADVALRAGVTVTDGVTSYGLDVADLLTEAKAFAATICGRDPEYGFDETAITDETHDGRGTIFVKHPPVVSVSELAWDGTAYESTDYHVYTDRIELDRDAVKSIESYGPEWNEQRIMTLGYTGGYSDEDGTHIAIPTELKSIVRDLAIRMLLRIEMQRGGESRPGVSKLQVGNYSASFSESDSELSDLIRRLRRGKWCMTYLGA